MGEHFFKKSQQPPKTTVTDPYRDQRDVANRAESVLAGNLGQSHAGFGSAYASPSGLQTQSMNDLSGYLHEGIPLYNAGVGQLERTAAGAYLDPTVTPAYQNYKTAQTNLANQVFGEQAGQIGSRMSVRNNYDSSARQNQIAGAAADVGGKSAQELFAAGAGLYGAERGRQDAAAGAGMDLAPSLAESIFKNEEEIRAGQQSANEAQMRAQLEGMGLQGEQVDSMLAYMATIKPEAARYTQGKSIFDQLLDAADRWSAVPAMKGGDKSSGSDYDPNSWSGSKSSGYWV